MATSTRSNFSHPHILINGIPNNLQKKYLRSILRSKRLKEQCTESSQLVKDGYISDLETCSRTRLVNIDESEVKQLQFVVLKRTFMVSAQTQ